MRLPIMPRRRPDVWRRAQDAKLQAALEHDSSRCEELLRGSLGLGASSRGRLGRTNLPLVARDFAFTLSNTLRSEMGGTPVFSAVCVPLANEHA
jgi:hypothetical protein